MAYQNNDNVVGTVMKVLRACPNNPLASAGCIGRGLHQAASIILYIACFAFLVHNRLARFLADEGLSEGTLNENDLEGYARAFMIPSWAATSGAFPLASSETPLFPFSRAESRRIFLCDEPVYS